MSPLYNYQCVECGEKFEKLVKKDAKPPRCPTCDKPTQQICSVPAVAVWKCSKGSL